MRVWGLGLGSACCGNEQTNGQIDEEWTTRCRRREGQSETKLNFNSSFCFSTCRRNKFVLLSAPQAPPEKTHILECQPLGYSFAEGCNAMWGAQLTPAPTGGHLDLAPDVEASTTARHLVRMTAQQAR